MPSRSKKKPRPAFVKSPKDLADVIRAMTFEDLAIVGMSFRDMLAEDDTYDIDSDISVASMLNNWAQNQGEE